MLYIYSEKITLFMQRKVLKNQNMIQKQEKLSNLYQ